MSVRAPHAEQAEARERLRHLIEAYRAKWNGGALPLYIIIRSVSRSGMSRKMSFYADAPGGLSDITEEVAALLGQNVNVGNGAHSVTIRGTGMDMAWHAAYRVEYALTGDNTASPRMLSAVVL